MKNLRKKLTLQPQKNKQLEKDPKIKLQTQAQERIQTEISSNFSQKSSADWKREREFLFSKIKALEKEVNSLKSKNQELQIQLTLTQTSIETKQSFATTTNGDNVKIPKRRIDHKRIYSEMFTSYRKKKLKQNSEDGKSGLGVLKQLVKQKPKSFGEGTKGIIGNKILSNIIKEFRIDLQEQKKLEKKNLEENIHKNGQTLNNNKNNNFNNKVKKGNNNNKFMKNLTTKINNNNYQNKKSNNNNKNNNKFFAKKKDNKIQINDNNSNSNNNTIINGNNKKKIICETMNTTENISLADGTHNKSYIQPENELSNNLNGEYYGFYDINIDNNNDDFTEKINESSSGQTYLTGETILKKPNDFNSNINTSNSLSKSKSNSTMNQNQINNENNNLIKSNFVTNNLKNTPPSSISQSSSVIFQPYSGKLEGFSSPNSFSSKRSGGRSGPTMALWDLEKILKYSKIEEPFIVFRMHTTPIFTVSGPTNKKLINDYLNNVSVYSSGSDGVIRGFQIPGINTQNTEDNLNKYTLLSWRVHRDMIWQLNYHPSNFLLASVSSDGSVKIFKTYELYDEKIIPIVKI